MALLTGMCSDIRTPLSNDRSSISEFVRMLWSVRVGDTEKKHSVIGVLERTEKIGSDQIGVAELCCVYEKDIRCRNGHVFPKMIACVKHMVYSYQLGTCIARYQREYHHGRATITTPVHRTCRAGL